MAGINHTLSAPGATPVVTCTKAAILIDFGAGSCDVEIQMDNGQWVKLESGITTDYAKVFATPAKSKIRVLATIVSGDIRVNIRPGNADI